jgi:hypothetical protein
MTSLLKSLLHSQNTSKVNITFVQYVPRSSGTHGFHSIQNGGLYHFLFLQAFDNFLGFYVLYKDDMHKKNLNSLRIFQEINIFAHFYFLVLE